MKKGNDTLISKSKENQRKRENKVKRNKRLESSEILEKEIERRNKWICRNIDLILDSINKLKSLKRNKSYKQKEIYYIKDAIKSINIMIKLSTNYLQDETKSKISLLNKVTKSISDNI